AIVTFSRTTQMLRGNSIDEGIEVPQDFIDIDELTSFAVDFRYDLFVESEEESFDRQESLDIVRKVWLWVDSLLPASEDNSTIKNDNKINLCVLCGFV
ncbi:MAG: hypothetical protein QME81_06825, partial [bacterium]|nr:hypothetical protein [bacterium]